MRGLKLQRYFTTILLHKRSTHALVTSTSCWSWSWLSSWLRSWYWSWSWSWSGWWSWSEWSWSCSWSWSLSFCFRHCLLFLDTCFFFRHLYLFLEKRPFRLFFLFRLSLCSSCQKPTMQRFLCQNVALWASLLMIEVCFVVYLSLILFFLIFGVAWWPLLV
jgi:hypothetical protein